MKVLWTFKEPKGYVTKKTFPYLTEAWKVTDQEGAYFVGLTADIGMDTLPIWELTKQVLGYFEDIETGNFVLESDNYDVSSIKKLSIREQIASQVQNRTSAWYADSLRLICSSPDLKVMLEPQSDGTEIGVFFFGANAEKAYEGFVNWAKKLAT